MGITLRFHVSFLLLVLSFLFSLLRKTTEQTVACTICTTANRRNCCEQHKRCCDTDESLGVREPGICPNLSSTIPCTAKCALDSECPLQQRCCQDGKSVSLICAKGIRGKCPPSMSKSSTNHSVCIDTSDCNGTMLCCPDRRKAPGCCLEQIPVTTLPSTSYKELWGVVGTESSEGEWK